VKLHFHLVLKIVDTLEQIFSENRYADKVLEKTFKQNRQLGARDRKFFAETVYEIVRHFRFYAEVMKSEDNFDLIAAHLIKANGDLPDWEEFSGYDVEKIRNRLKYKHEDKILYSFPDWLHELGVKEFGDEWPLLMKALNQPALVYLRTNTLKITREKLKEEFAKEDIQTEFVPDFPDCLVLPERKNVFITNCFKKGFFEVQDASSQLIAPLLEVAPGLRVADTCAGAGGKTLHMASLMKNKGKIIAINITRNGPSHKTWHIGFSTEFFKTQTFGD
jgi:16S rRNA (cytosine967-C5)-methyltransferase